MGDEQDSWFKKAFGVDPAEAFQGIQDFGNQVVQGVQQAVTGVAEAAAGAAKKVTGSGSAPPPKPAAPPPSATPAGSFPLSGSVGRGGQNAVGDVKAVQKALGIPADGLVGPQTIAAIAAFQKKMGMAAPDGRVDRGGATERALSGGAQPAAPPASPPQAPPPGDDDSGLFDRFVKGAKDIVDSLDDLGGKIVENLPDDFPKGLPKGLPGGPLNPLVQDLEADHNQGIAERIIFKLNTNKDLSADFGFLNGMDMRSLLDVMARLKSAGKLEAFADRTPTEKQRIGVAILTIRPEFDELWRSIVAKLNEADRKAVLERTPKDVRIAKGFARPEDKIRDKDDPNGNVVVDPEGLTTQAKLEFHSKDFGFLGRVPEFAVTIGPDGKLENFEIEMKAIQEKLTKLGKLGPILDLEGSLSLVGEAELKQTETRLIFEGVQAKVKGEIQVSFKQLPGALRKVLFKLTATAGTGGFSITAAIEIPIPLP